MKSNLFRPILFLLFPLLVMGTTGDIFTGKVTSVTDGDTITALENGQPVSLRIYGIDAPEPSQPYGDRAHQLAKALSYQEVVKVEKIEQDKYKRWVSRVYFLDGRSFSEEMIKAGLAWWYRKFAPNDKKLEALEKKARDAKIGLWADENPTPPWEYRDWPFCASKNSGIYHPCDCPTVKRDANEKSGNVIAYRNLIRFKTEQDAIDSGRRRCKCANLHKKE